MKKTVRVINFERLNFRMYLVNIERNRIPKIENIRNGIFGTITDIIEITGINEIYR